MSKLTKCALLTLAAFFVFGLSITANAKPGDGDAPPPFDVNVVNTPDVNIANTPDVNVSNSVLTIQPVSTPGSKLFDAGTFTHEITFQSHEGLFDEDVVLTGVSLQIQVPPTANDYCNVMVSLIPANEPSVRLASGTALPGNGIAERYVPLPNVLASAGDTLYWSINPEPNGVGATCHVELRVHGVILD